MSDYRCLRPVPSKNFPREFTRCLKKEDDPIHVDHHDHISAVAYGDGLYHPVHSFQRSSLFELQPWARR